ncbi:MAG: hypothetical protein V4482_02715 [Pseudomonadota bacterium]
MKKKPYFCLILSLGLSACDRVDSIKSHYEEKPQILLNANSIVVTRDFNTYSKLPESDKLFSSGLAQSIEKWAKVRLRPHGKSGMAQLAIQDASIIELPNPHNPEEIVGRLDVILTLHNKTGDVLSVAEAQIRQKVLAPINVTEKELKVLMQSLITKLVDELDREIEGILLRMAKVTHKSIKRIK